MTVHRRRALASAAAMLALAACATVPDAAPGSAAGNPIFVGADPSVLISRDRDWIFATGDGQSLRGWVADETGSWRPGPVLLRMADIGWIADGARRHYLWAPHMVAANGRFHLFYSVGPQNPTPSRIGVAVADRIEGPFVDSGRPLVTGGDGFEAIDPMVFADPGSGGMLLLAGGSAGATLRMFELAPDLSSIVRRLDIAQPLRFTEAPFLHRRGDTYYLSYSHGSWERSSYSVHYATAASPTGPWTYRGPILTSSSRYKGPGHHAFFQDPASGEWSIAYHRWQGIRGDGPYRGRRRVAIDAVRYRPDGSIEPIRMTP